MRWLAWLAMIASRAQGAGSQGLREGRFSRPWSGEWLGNSWNLLPISIGCRNWPPLFSVLYCTQVSNGGLCCADSWWMSDVGSIGCCPNRAGRWVGTEVPILIGPENLPSEFELGASSLVKVNSVLLLLPCMPGVVHLRCDRERGKFWCPINGWPALFSAKVRYAPQRRIVGATHPGLDATAAMHHEESEALAFPMQKRS